MQKLKHIFKFGEILCMKKRKTIVRHLDRLIDSQYHKTRTLSSLLSWHCSQRPFATTYHFCKLSLVGNDSLIARQRKWRTFWGTWSSQIPFHKPLPSSTFEELGWSWCWTLTNKWYTLWTEYTPSDERGQIKASESTYWLTDIILIALASYGKKFKSMSSSFDLLEPGWNRSLTTCKEWFS